MSKHLIRFDNPILHNILWTCLIHSKQGVWRFYFLVCTVLQERKKKHFKETYEENLLHITKQSSFWSFLCFMHSSMLSLQPLSDLDGPVWMFFYFILRWIEQTLWNTLLVLCSAHFRCTFTTASDKSVQIFKSVRLSSSPSAKHSFLNKCPFFASHYVLCTATCKGGKLMLQQL